MATELGIAPASAPEAVAETGGLLSGRRIVVTGVLTDRSLAHATAALMQRMGAEVVLTGHGRSRRLTERAAVTLPRPPEVLELDVLRDGDFQHFAGELSQRWEWVDGVFHSIAYAPPVLWEREFVDAEPGDLDTAMRTSVYSLSRLTGALLPALRSSPHGGSVVGLTVLGGRTEPFYRWMSVVKAALDGLIRQLAVQLGPSGVRANLIASGPVKTNAARGIPQFDELRALYGDRAPLGWSGGDTAVVAGPACFLMSDLSRAITGEILNVMGGAQAAV